MEVINRNKGKRLVLDGIFIAQAHCCLLEAAARGTLINDTIKPQITSQCRVTSLVHFWKDAFEVKLNHFYEGIKGVTTKDVLFMDTVNAKVGSLASVDISLITTFFIFLASYV